MRIFLLPISTRQALVYCQQLSKKPAAQASILERVTRKAAETWAKFEAADKGWQKTLVEYGNYGLKRIPYQEWGLKSFPSSNPDLQAEQVTAGTKFDVVYPGNMMQKEDVPKVLARLAKERKNLHYKRFIGSMIAVPFTLPFALVPIIPNIPGFYMAYRCWSHWKALKGSDHLDFLLDHRLFRPISTPAIEDIYQKTAPTKLHSFNFVTRSQIEDGSAQKEELVLQPGSHTIVARDLEVSELATEVDRAIWQIEQALQKEQQTVQSIAQPQSDTPASTSASNGTPTKKSD